MWPGRILGWLDGDEAGSLTAKIRSFELVFVVALVAEYWCRALLKWDRVPAEFLAGAWLASIVGPFTLIPRWRRLAFLTLALSHSGIVFYELPATANHSYLQVAFCLLAAALRPEDEQDAVLYLRSARWMAIVVLFYSGMQKVVHGYYFRAEYLSFALGSPSYRPLLRPLLPAAEYQRLIAYTGQIGDGPFRSSALPFIAVSNLVYVLEMGLALLLLVPGARVFAAAAVVALMVIIEIGARELFFGITFVNAVLLFLPGNGHRRLAPFLIVAVITLVLVATGLLPTMRFT